MQLVRVESRPTNLHWNVEPVSLEVNPKVAVVPITLGGLVKVVSGGVVSVPPLLVEVNPKVAVVPMTLGGLVKVVSGGVVSVPPSEAGNVTTSRIALCPVPVPP